MSEDKKQIEDGGPAYPTPDIYHPNGEIQYGAVGMTLRDHFATEAMSGMWANSGTSFDIHADPSQKDAMLRLVAHIAYKQADAMIVARKEGSQ